MQVNGSGGVLTVKGTFGVHDLTFTNGSTVDIQSGGSLTVTRDLTNNNNSDDVVFDGGIQVDGDFDAGNGSDIAGTGTFTVDGTISQMQEHRCLDVVLVAVQEEELVRLAIHCQ